MPGFFRKRNVILLPTPSPSQKASRVFDPHMELAFLRAAAEIPSFGPSSFRHFIELSFITFAMKNLPICIDLKNISAAEEIIIKYLKQTF